MHSQVFNNYQYIPVLHVQKMYNIWFVDHTDNFLEMSVSLESQNINFTFLPEHFSHNHRTYYKEKCNVVLTQARLSLVNRKPARRPQKWNQWGCDECFICYTSKFQAELPELEEHPDTFYVHDHNPTSTKLQFAARVRRFYIL